jgi:hypothetical protein
MKTLFYILAFNICAISFAQDPQLFENTWYLEKISVDNVEYILANYYTAEPAVTEFDEAAASIFTSVCNYLCFYATTSFNSGGNQLNLSAIEECILTGDCAGSNPDLYFFSDLYFTVFYYWDSSLQTIIIQNPFTYSLQMVNGYQQLTITSGKGDWAVYNSKLLSTSPFTHNSFTLYPNPVEDILYIHTASNEEVNASIYDLSGKLLQSYVIDAPQIQIDVNQLRSGLYFMVFESRTGHRMNKKFVKQ